MARTSPSLADIARDAGVSITSVSRILAGTASVRPDTAARVTAAAERLGYRPNLLVRGMQTGRTRTVGVMVPVDDPYYAQMVTGIHDALVAADHVPLLLWSGGARAPMRNVTELEQLHRLIDRRVDGVILRPVTDQADDAYLHEAHERGLPVVVVDRELPNSTTDFVGSDDTVGARMAAEHLLALGHRRLGHCAGALFTSTGRRRHEGFGAALAGTGATCVVAEDPTFSDGETQAAHFLATAPRPTALFCANDLLAAGAYRAAARLGLRIPADVSVVGFADLPFAGLMAPPLTTIRQDPYAIGQAAVQRLLARCDGDRAPPIHQLIPVALTVRASTAAVRTERS